jgi:hypothetical protein
MVNIFACSDNADMIKIMQESEAMEPAEKTKVKSKNGDLFIVMNEERRVALGLIARGNNRSGKLGFFFDLKYYDRVADKACLKLDYKQAVYVCKFSYLEIRNGNWPTVGALKGFSFETWPMPVFEHNHYDTRFSAYRRYDEERLEQQVFSCYKSQLPRGFDLSFVVEDGDAGAFFVAERLERLLGMSPGA